jgi:hypothetical protein
MQVFGHFQRKQYPLCGHFLDTGKCLHPYHGNALTGFSALWKPAQCIREGWVRKTESLESKG